MKISLIKLKKTLEEESSNNKFSENMNNLVVKKVTRYE